MNCEDESCAFAETHDSKVAERNTFLYMLNTEKGTPTTCGRALRVIEFLRIFSLLQNRAITCEQPSCRSQ